MGNQIDFSIPAFVDCGYMGLYGGLTTKDIHAKKELKPLQRILDHMGFTELAANYFRVTQTEEIIKREHLEGKEEACQVYFDVGAKVRQTIKELGNPMPEDLATLKDCTMNIDDFNKLQAKPPIWLSGINLSNRFLPHANFEGGIISHANLSKAVLVSVNLKRSDLSCTNLAHTDLTEAMLNNAVLEYSDLNHVHAIKADFSNANLWKADLSDADFTQCNFQHANLMEVKLQNTRFIDCNLSGAILVNANLQGADMSGSTMEGAVLMGANFDQATLDRVNLIDSKINEGQLLQTASAKNITLQKPGEDRIQTEWIERVVVELFLEDDLLSQLETDARNLELSLNEYAVFILMNHIVNQKKSQFDEKNK